MSQQTVTLAPSALPVAEINANFDELYASRAQLLSGTPLWVKVGTLTHTDFSAAATSKAVNLFQLPAGAMIHATRIKHSAAFAGGAISAYTVSVGITGSADKYAAAFDVNQAVSDTAFQDSTPTALAAETLAGATQIKATATSTSANLSVATAGSVDIWCQMSLPPS